MSLINRKSFILDDEEIERNLKTYKLPTLVTSKPELFSFSNSLVKSMIIHLIIFILSIVLAFIVDFLNIHFGLFEKPKIDLKKDIEFVLVDREAPPKNPNTKNRADMNSRTGGKNDPTRKVSMPSPTPKKASKPAAPKANKTVKQQVKKQQVQTNKNTAPTKTQSVQKPSPAKPAPPSSRPSSRPVAAPTPIAKPSGSFSVPAPKNAPIGKTLATGPIGGSSAPTGAKTGVSGATSASRNGAYAPRPSLSPSSSGGSGGQLGRSGYSNAGNPGGGGGAPGVDALREPDFGPYMRELQNRIKNNWNPPKGNESKRVVLLFKIAKDGRLLSCRIHRSSGLQTADQAALKAVELTAPFRPLPADFRGQSIDIQFTFDYNVFGASKY